MRIGIMADGGITIGMGHIMRTLVLAKELCKTEEVFYICKSENGLSDKYKFGIDKVRKEGFRVKLIDEKRVIEELKNIQADVLITDSYNVDEEYFNKTKSMFSKTGYIDDNNLLPYYNVDFLINQNLGAEELQYKVNQNTKLLLGAKYIMLREEFRNAYKREINKEVLNIMITMGGADANGITNIICKYIKDLKYKFHIIIGPSFDEENIKKLLELKKITSNFILYFNAKMIEVMKKSDIAISACGSTLYELAAFEIPTLGIIIADNQERLAYKMDEEGLIYNLGWYKDLTKDIIIDNISKISKLNNRKIMSKKQEAINKNGVEELALKI